MMTVRVSDERSSRFYTENVQQNYCTYKKLKSLFLHTRHLLPAADCGKGKEGLTAKVTPEKAVMRFTFRGSITAFFRFYPRCHRTRYVTLYSP